MEILIMTRNVDFLHSTYTHFFPRINLDANRISYLLQVTIKDISHRFRIVLRR